MLIRTESTSAYREQSWPRGRLAAGKPAVTRGRMQRSRPINAQPIAMGVSLADRVALPRWRIVPWRLAVAAGLLSLLLAVALVEGLAGKRPVVSRAVHPDRVLSSLPLAMQGAISGAMGANERAYRVRASEGGLRAVNPAQHLGMRFDRSGVRVGSGGKGVGLDLRAVGYGSSLRPVGGASPRMRADRVLYSRAGLSEWYVNGPLGLEQGFTVARAPAGPPAGPLTLSMAVSGNLHASLAAGGQSVTFSAGRKLLLRYGELVASDARGRRLHTDECQIAEHVARDRATVCWASVTTS
jgi:hypothetical protein